MTQPDLRPIADFPASARRALKGVFADIDDTLTTEGRLTAEAYAAMERLQRAGLLVVPITGRPAGWCDHFARMWPIDAIVGENGAFYFHYDRNARKLTKRFIADKSERESNRRRLSTLRQQILDEVPGCGIASDQLYREADLAIDFCEDVDRLPAESVAKIVNLFEAAGATAKVSSIHVNGWFGSYDKLTMTRIAMAECFGLDLDAEKAHFTFVGDSPNDAPMFGFFPHSVGVANVRDFEAQLPAAPTYVTEAACGAGFAELATLILQAAEVPT